MELSQEGPKYSQRRKAGVTQINLSAVPLQIVRNGCVSQAWSDLRPYAAEKQLPITVANR